MDIVWILAGAVFFVGCCGLVSFLDHLREEE
jgi:hypothetical protein